jgi:hypothetical protein
MNRTESPPGKKAAWPARPDREAARRSTAEYSSKPPLSSDGEPAPNKALLEHINGIWLFEIREAHSVSYVVEKGERVWQFSLLYSAQGKFAREVTKARGGRES